LELKCGLELVELELVELELVELELDFVDDDC
jgi:hypothetical protein